MIVILILIPIPHGFTPLDLLHGDAPYTFHRRFPLYSTHIKHHNIYFRLIYDTNTRRQGHSSSRPHSLNTHQTLYTNVHHKIRYKTKKKQNTDMNEHCSINSLTLNLNK